MTYSRKRVLFFAEGATLAHVARLFVLSETLPGQSFEAILARPSSYAWLSRGGRWSTVDLPCQEARVFAGRLERGQPLYELDTLSSYVEKDLELISETRPDVIVGDFRLSLSVSARLAGIPYATVCDAYWSPEAPLRPIVPVMPLTRMLPIPVAQGIFSAVSPLAFRHHARPMAALRRRYGLPSLGHDLRLAYTDADLRLFANPPALFPEVKAHPGAAFLGPVAWSPDVELPADLSDQEDLIYVTMGSSGSTRALEAVFAALARLGHPAVVASAGRDLPLPPQSSNIRVFDFLPGLDVVARSRLVICNGGSPTTNQALAAGVPVLGIPSNMDQFLNMDAIARYGCGLSVRADRASTGAIGEAIAALLDEGRGYARAAAAVQETTKTLDTGAEFARLLTRLVAGRTDPRA